MVLNTTGGDGAVAMSCPTLVTPWTVAFQFPLSMGFSRQDYWSGLLCPHSGDLLDPGMAPSPLMSSAFEVDSCIAGGFFTD